jgi:CRISPR-associated protein Csm2
MADQHGQQRNYGNQNRYPEHHAESMPNLDGIKNRIKLGSKPLDPELFNGTAQEAAKTIANADKNANKSTQLRRFYDELVLWDTRVQQAKEDERAEKLQGVLPFIRMINAKTAYAEGRKPRLVTTEFVDLMRHTLGQVEDPKTLNYCKLFWEAFMGFYKQERKD